MVELGLTVLRLAGVAYLIGGVFAGYRATTPATGGADPVGRGAVVLDGARQSWRVVNALLFMAAGAAMIWGRQAAAALLGALLVQQSVYIARQAWVAKSNARAGRARAQDVSMPTKAAIAATVLLVIASVMLERLGALS